MAITRDVFRRAGGWLCFAALVGCGVPRGLPPADSPGMDGAARNIILFIGDGMGVSTVTAARIFDGQAQGMSGEEHALVFETFPHVALVKTYNTNQQVPDSAGTATAMMTGRKTRAGVINVGPQARRRNCAEALAHPLKSLGEIARERGKSVGVVTTARLTHATPASVYARSPERDWESDRYLPPADRAQGCRDIASQLVHFDIAGGLDVALGGGRAEFFGGDLGGNRRAAQDDLVSEWLQAAPGRAYVTTRNELQRVQPGRQVLGLFSRSHMTYVAERTPDTAEPTLAEMTLAALDLLMAGDESEGDNETGVAAAAENASGAAAERDNGFFLMVEGGRIDHGHHEGLPGYAMLETQAFARAIEAALERVDLRDTLVLVTADHSHVFTMAGYPVRGNPILGLVLENDVTGEPEPSAAVDANGTPYTTLGYANGPGAAAGQPRPVPEVGPGAVYQALVRVARTRMDGSTEYGETHGGEDVALYGIGAGSARVGGVIEQNVIFDIMTMALGWEPISGNAE